MRLNFFTAVLLLMSTANNFEASASETTPYGKSERALFEGDPDDILQSPLRYIYSPCDMDKSDEQDFASNPLCKTDQGATDEEDLYEKIDPKPAERVMDNILHYLYYQSGGESKELVAAEYPDIPPSELGRHLTAKVMQLIDDETPDPLSVLLGKLLIQNNKLQAKCKKLEEEQIQLEKDCASRMSEDRQSLVKVLVEALGEVPVPSVTGLPELKKKIIALRNAKASLEKEKLTLLKENKDLASENVKLSKQILEFIQKPHKPSEEN